MRENSSDRKGTFNCKQCGREYSSEWFCKNCYGLAGTTVFDRIMSTATNDEMLHKVNKLDSRLEAIEEMLREIRIRLIPTKSKQTSWGLE